MVRVAGFEPTASWSRTMRATNCATPGYLISASNIIATPEENVKPKTATAENGKKSSCLFGQNVVKYISLLKTQV